MINSRTNLFIKIAVSVMVVVCLVTILRLQIQFNQLNEDRKLLKEQVKEYYADIEELPSEAG